MGKRFILCKNAVDITELVVEILHASFFFPSISHRIVSEICVHQLPNQYEILSPTYSHCFPRIIIRLLVLTAEERLVLNISSEQAAAFF